MNWPLSFVGAMRTRVKICCIASLEEAELALRGADALGLVGAMPSGPGILGDDGVMGAELAGFSWREVGGRGRGGAAGATAARSGRPPSSKPSNAAPAAP